MTSLPYKIFTTAHDRVVDAADIAPAALSEHETSGLRPPQEAEAVADGLGTVDEPVQVLLDMSGSNRGMHDRIIGYVDLIARGLEAAGVRFEVLGFTTAEWKGGRSRQDWLAAGKPQGPGRVADLLHVVFKEPDASWAASPDGVRPSPATALDMLYRPGHLKENVDGEAIRWAMTRLPKGVEGRLLFVSDGAPVDDSTFALNAGNILADDLARALGEAARAGIRVAKLDVHDHREDADLEGEVVKVRKSSDPVEVARQALSRILPEHAPAPTP